MRRSIRNSPIFITPATAGTSQFRTNVTIESREKVQDDRSTPQKRKPGRPFKVTKRKSALVSSDDQIEDVKDTAVEDDSISMAGEVSEDDRDAVSPLVVENTLEKFNGFDSYFDGPMKWIDCTYCYNMVLSNPKYW